MPDRRRRTPAATRCRESRNASATRAISDRAAGSGTNPDPSSARGRSLGYTSDFWAEATGSRSPQGIERTAAADFGPPIWPAVMRVVESQSFFFGSVRSARRSSPDRLSALDRRSPVRRISSSNRLSISDRLSLPVRRSLPDRLLSSPMASLRWLPRIRIDHAKDRRFGDEYPDRTYWVRATASQSFRTTLEDY